MMIRDETICVVKAQVLACPNRLLVEQFCLKAQVWSAWRSKNGSRAAKEANDRFGLSTPCRQSGMEPNGCSHIKRAEMQIGSRGR